MKTLTIKEIFDNSRQDVYENVIVDFFSKMFYPAKMYYSSDSPEPGWRDPIAEVINRTGNVVKKYASPTYPGKYLNSAISALKDLHERKYINSIRVYYDNVDRDAKQEVVVDFSTKSRSVVVVFNQDRIELKTSDNKYKKVNIDPKNEKLTEEIYHSVFMMAVR